MAFHMYVRPAQIVFQTTHKLLVQFHPNFTGMISTKCLVEHIVSIFRFNDFCPSYDLLIIKVFFCVARYTKACPDYFSKITEVISYKLYRNDQYQV
jgi:hypothetical protein